MRRLVCVVLSASLLLAGLPPEAVFAVGQQRGEAPGHSVGGAQGAHVPQAGAPLKITTLGVETPAGVANAAATPPVAGGAASVAVAPEAAVAQAAAVVEASAAQSAEGGAKSDSSASPIFDGSSDVWLRQPGPVALAASGLIDKASRSSLGRFMPRSLVAKAERWAKPSTSIDAFGGPRYQKLDLKEQTLLGLRWGVYLTALSSLVSGVIDTIGSWLPWNASFPYVAAKLAALPPLGDIFPSLKAASQSHMELLALIAGKLSSFSLAETFPELVVAPMMRMELLVDWGPLQIMKGMGENLLGFVFKELPKATALEELYYRVFIFAGILLPLMALKPISQGALKLLGQVRSYAVLGLDHPARWLFSSLGWLSRFAFPIAAVVSAVQFGRAHFMSWGLNADAFLTPLTAGLVLAYLAYRTRSFLPGLIAHLSYNAVVLGVFFAMMILPAAASGFSTLVTAGSLIFLTLALWRRYKERAAVSGGTVVGAVGAAGFKAFNLVAASLVALVLFVGPTPHSSPGSLTTSSPKPEAPIVLAESPKTEAPLSVVEIVKRSKPAVVQILINTADGRTAGSGSGFIISKEGLVVTNNHVVGPVGIGGTVVVQFTDGKKVPATVLAANKRDDIDLAFLQLPKNPEGWPTVPIGSSAQLEEGAAVIAMGYPFGLEFTVTSGIASGKGGKKRGYELQTDAAVNPGNSGGPSFNDRGEVIGVNTAIYSRTGAFNGISFARSTEVLRNYLKLYEATGSISPAWLGVIVDRSNPYGGLLPGVTVENVRPSSPAAKAGLQPGDRIVMLDAKKIAPGPLGLMGLSQALLAKKLGDSVTLTVERDEASVTLKVTLGEWLAKPGKLFGHNAKEKPGQNPEKKPDPGEDEDEEGAPDAKPH